MSLVRNKAFGVSFWLVAFAAVIAGAVVGGKVGNGGAPEFGDGSGASASSHLIFAIGGALFCGGLVIAVFAGIWMTMWALDRRAHPPVVEDADVDNLDALDFEFDHYDEEVFTALRR